MGNYVQSHLTKEEHVVFEAHYNWSCIVGECGEAKFTGSNKLEYTISTLIHEGETNLDNVYGYETKSLTLK